MVDEKTEGNDSTDSEESEYEGMESEEDGSDEDLDLFVNVCNLFLNIL